MRRPCRPASTASRFSLLTMIGDGHTAYGGNSACIDAAVEASLFELRLPAEGTKCRQEVPFEAPAPPEAAQTQRAGREDRRPIVRPHVKPVGTAWSLRP